PDPRFLRSPFDGHRLDLGPVHVIGARLAVVAVAIVISAALFLFLRGTFGGVLFRAVAGDRYTARLMGVNVGRFDTVLWTVSGMLAGAAAIAVAPLVNFGVFFMSLLLLRAFGAAVLGGMTSVLGCLVAGIAIGIGEAVLTRELHVPGIGEVVVAGVVIAALASRPAALAR
ncbi:MAG: branched-chain amino acid transport system permease protein, partial [Actinomycetota bacterium]|nr:branched-chain amino acid transport system permease protein [Actinomycetota bacterium]